MTVLFFPIGIARITKGPAQMLINEVDPPNLKVKFPEGEVGDFPFKLIFLQQNGAFNTSGIFRYAFSERLVWYGEYNEPLILFESFTAFQFRRWYTSLSDEGPVRVDYLDLEIFVLVDPAIGDPPNDWTLVNPAPTP